MVENIKSEMIFLKTVIEDLVLEMDMYNTVGEYRKSAENARMVNRYSKRLETLQKHLDEINELYSTLGDIKEKGLLKEVVDYYEQNI